MLKIDASDFEKAARNLGATTNQLPFIVAKTLNDSAFATRKRLINETWPQHVTVRNRGFLGASLRVEKASKTNLAVSIVDVLGRGHLLAHADGGEKTPRGQNLAIPPVAATGAHGLPANQRPRAIAVLTPKRALRITAKGIFVGQGGSLRLKFALAPRAQIRRDVPFRSDFARMFTEELVRSLPAAVERAMSTAFRR